MVNTSTEMIVQRSFLSKATSIAQGAREVGIKGTIWAAPFVALEAANAPRGYKMSDGVASAITQLTVAPAFTAAAYIGLAVAFPFIGTGIVAVLAASTLAAPAANFVQSRLNRGFREFRNLDRSLNRMNLGFQDSATSQSYRQQAIMEMTGAFSSSRKYLGSEARFLHR